MNKQGSSKKGGDGPPCAVCGKHRPASEMVPAALVRPAVAALIRRDHPDWSAQDAICLADLHRYRLAHLAEVLEAEHGDLSALDRDVLSSIEKNEVIAPNVDDEAEAKTTLGGRVADRVAKFGGSWTFIITFFLIIVGWITVNVVVLAGRPFDPYPFILLNLALSCLAAIQAPIIMMSQNRQETKDRARAEHDYQINLKAELEVRLLHEKIDHLMLHQWHRLIEIQHIQSEMIEDITARLERAQPGRSKP
jgi:uncharacterized membrane protein